MDCEIKGYQLIIMICNPLQKVDQLFLIWMFFVFYKTEIKSIILSEHHIQKLARRSLSFPKTKNDFKQ